MKISVVVTTYNRPDALARVLEGLAEQTRLADEVIVADDGSCAATKAVVQSRSAAVPYRIEHIWHEDHGFRAAKIRNDAIRFAMGDYLVLLDGDCIPNRHFIKDHLRLARPGSFFQGKRVLVKKEIADTFDKTDANRTCRLIRLMLSGKLENSHHLVRCTWCPPLSSPGLTGTRSCNMGIFKSDLLAVNGFNEAFVGWGREDTELVVRLYRYGLNRRIHPFMAICFHLWHAQNCRDRLTENDDILKTTVASNGYYTHQGVVKKS